MSEYIKREGLLKRLSELDCMIAGIVKRMPYIEIPDANVISAQNGKWAHIPERLKEYHRDQFGQTDYKDSIFGVAALLLEQGVKADKSGSWVGLEYDGYADGNPVYDLWECSECGEEVRGEDVPETHPYCHGCGAKMTASQI